MHKNDYIIRRKKDMWHFFHADGTGLCLRKKQNGFWGNSQVLLDNAFYDFSAVCDGQDNIHMVCQDTDGDILYLAYHHDQWHKYTLMKSKAGSAYAKHFKILLTGSQLQLFYTVRSNNKLILVHQLLGSEGAPLVVDAVQDSARPFFVACDDYLNTWIYYQSSSGMLGIKRYSWSSKSLEDFQPADEIQCECPFVYIDEYERHHIICIQKGRLLYMQRDLQGAYVKKHYITNPENDVALYLPIILGDDKKLWMMWNQNNKVHYCILPLERGEMGEISSFISPANVDMQLLSFQREAACFYCWGYILDGEIQLFAAGSADRPVTSKSAGPRPQPSPEAPKTQREGKEVEDFSARHMAEFGVLPPPETQSHISVDIAKINIAVSSLGDQITKLKKQVNQLLFRLDKLEKEKKDSEEGTS